MLGSAMDLNNFLDFLQWPAMVVTVLAAWLVASTRKTRRNIGFWTFLANNVMWVVWGLHAGAWALIALQVALAILNIRGVRKTEDPAPAEPPHGLSSQP